MKKLGDILTGPEKWLQNAGSNGVKMCLGTALHFTLRDELTNDDSSLENFSLLLQREQNRLASVIRSTHPNFQLQYNSVAILSIALANKYLIQRWNDDVHTKWSDVELVINQFDASGGAGVKT